MIKKAWLLLSVLACSSTSSWKPGQPLTLDLSSVFPAGTALRDQYSGAAATVASSGSVTITPDASGVVLFERDGATATSFSWANATVYFVMTDRFFNGDSSNDNSYGRVKDGAQEVGTWHGGDLKGLTAKLDYIASLGATAIWVSPLVEQVHGWVGGGTGDFKYYGYHGYWALDFTRLDQNFGTSADLTAFVDGGEIGARAEVLVEPGEVERPVSVVAVVLEVSRAAPHPAVDLLDQRRNPDRRRPQGSDVVELRRQSLQIPAVPGAHLLRPVLHSAVAVVVARVAVEEAVGHDEVDRRVGPAERGRRRAVALEEHHAARVGRDGDRAGGSDGRRRARVLIAQRRAGGKDAAQVESERLAWLPRARR